MAEADNNEMRSKADRINNTDLMSVDEADGRERVDLIDRTDLVSVDEVDEADQMDRTDQIDNTDLMVVDGVAEDLPAVTPSNTYQTMIQASIEASQNSVNLQEQLTLNSHTITTQNLDCILSRKRRHAGGSTTSSDRMLEIFRSLHPEHSSLIEQDPSLKSSTTRRHSNGLQYLNDVVKMLKTLQETS